MLVWNRFLMIPSSNCLYESRHLALIFALFRPARSLRCFYIPDFAHPLGINSFTMGALSQTNPRGLTILIICSVFGGLAIFAVCLRLWSRKLKRQQLCLNDYSVLIALVQISQFCALITSFTYTVSLTQLLSMALIGILAACASSTSMLTPCSTMYF